jgi:hypothetical protein
MPDKTNSEQKANYLTHVKLGIKPHIMNAFIQDRWLEG